MDGLPQNISSRLTIKIQSYNTRSCLSNPSYTPMNIYWIISSLLAAAAASCLLEVYASGIRAKLCQLFYPDRAEERADYLYYKIFTGRKNRKSQLFLSIRREMERRAKLVRFSPLERFRRLFRNDDVTRGHVIVCPGCGWREKKSKAKELSFDAVDKVINTKICRSCDNDLYD